MKSYKDLDKAKNNAYTCLSEIVSELMVNDNIMEPVVEELLDETIKYLGFIQRRLDEIVVKTDVDKGE